MVEEQETEDEDVQIRKKEREELKRYKLQQQHLMQLRSTFLSEALALRGIHVGPTMVDVVTPEGAKPPQACDWDCCMSTYEDPKTCLYSFDAEPNTKVVCPIGTNQYISLSALNRLRRTDPSKVEPMWHSQYSILKSWFSDESEFSLMQFVGFKGFVISTLLLDLGNGMALRGLLILGVINVVMALMPVIEIVIGRLLVSSFLWMKWLSWSRFAHAALPLKLLLGQMAWKLVATSFGKLEGTVRDYIVDLECSILEENIPVTVGEEQGDDDTEDFASDDEEVSEEEYDESDY